MDGSRTERAGHSKATAEMQDLLKLHRELDRRVINGMRGDNI